MFGLLSEARYYVTKLGIILAASGAALVALACIITITVLAVKYRKAKKSLDDANSQAQALEAQLDEVKEEITNIEKKAKAALKAQDEKFSAWHEKECAELKNSISDLQQQLVDEKKSQATSKRDNKKPKSAPKTADSQKKRLNDLEKQKKAIADDLKAAQAHNKELSAEIALLKAGRRTEDDDFEVRWKEYDCLAEVHNILRDASTAGSKSYVDDAIGEALEKIKPFLG